MEAPGALEVARFPMVNVPVCVFTSVLKCVLRRTHSVRVRACAKETPCVDETLGMSENPCVEATPCVSGVVASVPGCVLPSTPCVSEGVCVVEAPCMSETPRVSAPACVSGMVCVKETARVSERPSVRETACVRSLYVREMTVGMREHAATSPGVNVMEWRVSVVTRRCACVEWR